MDVESTDADHAGNDEAIWSSLWRRLGRVRAETDDFPERDRHALESTLRASLKTHLGDERARSRFAAIADRYRALSPIGKRTFFRTFASFDVDTHAVADLAARYTAEPDAHERVALRMRLRTALESPRTQLLSRFNGVPNGVKFLVDMRADLLAEAGDEFAELEADLKALLISWFDIGFLELQRITWDAPASLLERLANYEAVHEVRGWTDLKNRLDSDRRCYAFFHPAMPLEPLIFIELALTNSLTGSVAPLLDSTAPVGNPTEASVAIFYSISNCQRGLDGISFGNALIKRVVGEVATAFPNVKRFSTLSPLPGFRPWLEKTIAAAGNPPGHLLETLDERRWHRDSELTAALREPLLRLCARYLLDERRSGGRALDPVAHFHLSNGASVERINWMGDTSKRGLHESAGMMVNYLYRLDRIEANQTAYASGRIEASPNVLSLNDPENKSIANALFGIRRQPSA